jgi:hypothetical protein
VTDKPAWVGDLAPLDAGDRTALRQPSSFVPGVARGSTTRSARSRPRFARGGVADIVDLHVGQRAAFGEHRWTKKSCPYEACIGVPFLIRMPSVAHRTDLSIVSAADIAPTIAGLAGRRRRRRSMVSAWSSLLSTGSRAGLPGEVFAGMGWRPDDPGVVGGPERGDSPTSSSRRASELYALRTTPSADEWADDPAFEAEVLRLAATLETYRGVKRTAAVALGALLVLASGRRERAAEAAATRSSPDIVLTVTDDQRFDSRGRCPSCPERLRLGA